MKLIDKLYSPEQLVRAIELCKAGKSTEEVCKESGVSYNFVYILRKENNIKPPNRVSDEEKQKRLEERKIIEQNKIIRETKRIVKKTIQTFKSKIKLLKKDVTGKKFGKLTALSFSHRNNQKHAYWNFQCDCGNKTISDLSQIKNGTKSCGKCNKNKIDINKAIELKNQGLKYYQIKKELGCSNFALKYNLGKEEKNSNSSSLNKRIQLFQRNINKIPNYQSQISQNKDIKKQLKRRILKFRRKTYKDDQLSETFTLEQFLEKVGKNPKCYLTNDLINLKDYNSWKLDHILPRSKGGDNSLENCGLTTSQANSSKYTDTLEEHVKYCEKVLKNFGYKIIKE